MSTIFHHKCIRKKLLSCTTVVYTEMQTWSHIKRLTHFSSSKKEVSRRLAISDSKIAVPRLGFHPFPHEQQSSVRFEKTARRYEVLLQIQDLREPAKLDVHTISSPFRPHLASITFQAFHCRLFRRSVQSSSDVSVASVWLLASHVCGGIPQRSVPFRSQLVLPLKCRTHELRKHSKQLLMQSVGVVQRLEIIM